jgi:hypothetical protein
MLISKLCHDLDRVRARFGDMEVRCGGASITRIVVLPASEVDDGLGEKMVVALFVRSDDVKKRGHL